MRIWKQRNEWVRETVPAHNKIPTYELVKETDLSRSAQLSLILYVQLERIRLSVGINSVPAADLGTNASTPTSRTAAKASRES